MDFIKAIVDATTSPKANATVLAGSAAVLLFLLLASDKVLNRFGLLNFQTEYLTAFGILSIYSFAALLVHVGASMFGWAGTNVRRHMVISKRRKGLHSLTGEEKGFLRGFIEQETKTQALPYDHGVVQGLRNARVIYLASQVSREIGFGSSICMIGRGTIYIRIQSALGRIPKLFEGAASFAQPLLCVKSRACCKIGGWTFRIPSGTGYPNSQGAIYLLGSR